MKSFILWISLLATISTHSNAEDRPSWTIINAADRLIAQHALFPPSRDGFVKLSNGQLVQYELPTKNYAKYQKGWQVELLSRRWRKKEQGIWSEWRDARPQFDTWKIGVIHVDVLTSGVRAVWIDGRNFVEATPPIEAEVMQQLDTHGQSSSSTPKPPISAPEETKTYTTERSTNQTSSFTRQSTTQSGNLPPGMSRRAGAPTPTPPISSPTQTITGSNSTLTPIRSLGQPSTVTSTTLPPQKATAPAINPHPNPPITDQDAERSPSSFRGALYLLTIIAVIVSCLSKRKSGKKPPPLINRKTSPKTISRE